MYRISPAVSTAYLMIGFTAVLLAEELLFPVSTFSVLTSLIGIGALIFFLNYTEFGADKLGIAADRQDIPYDLRRAALICCGSIAAAVLLEQLIYSLLGKPGLFVKAGYDLGYFVLPNACVQEGGLPAFLQWALLGLLISAIRALFFEVGFRGFCLHLNAEEQGYEIGNLRQSICFTVLACIPMIIQLIQNLRTKELVAYSIPIALLAFLSVALGMFLLAYRQGLLRYATGSVWICVFSFFFFDYFNNFFHAYRNSPVGMALYADIFRFLLIQLAATGITALYLRRLKKNAQPVDPTQFTREPPHIHDDLMDP